MKADELIEIFGLKPTDAKRMEVNPLEVIGSVEFDKKETTLDRLAREALGRPPADYRLDSYNRVLGKRADFVSTCNHISLMVTEMIRVACPNCQKIMQQGGSGGTYNSHSTGFSCMPCKIHVSLTMATDGISVQFND